jgi:hypothetical protein
VPIESSQQPRARNDQQDQEAEGLASWDLSTIHVFPPDRTNEQQQAFPLTASPLPGTTEPKLAVGPIGDPLEREAGNVADQIMRTPDADVSTISASLQLSQKSAISEEVELQTSHVVGPGPVEDVIYEAPEVVHEVLRAPGQPLDASTCAFMEPRFGFDFSRVRLHTDSAAAESARAVNARAYTVGADVVFAPQMYAPHSLEGRRLLAHELAHVVQQSRPGMMTPAANPSHRLERDRQAVGRGPSGRAGRVNVSHANGVRIARQQANTPAPGTAPVSPQVANLPFSLYVDQFTECDYDVNYRVVNYFSNILHLKYIDGTELELDIEQDFTPESMTSEAARDAMANGKVGRGGRIFPSVLAPRTVPRLWAAREEALQIQNEAYANFAKLAVTGVVFVLSVPAMPAGVMDEAALGSIKATRRRMSGLTGTGPREGGQPPGNEPPTAVPPGGSPPGPGGGFNPIPYGQTAESLGRVIGARAAEGARTAAAVAKAAGEAGKSGPSWINRIISAVRPLKLAPGDSADVIESATTAASYRHGPRAVLQDGTLVVTSYQKGANQFIIGVHPDGSIVRGYATIDLGPHIPGGVSVTDVVWY